MMNAARSGKYSRETCANCGSCLRALLFTPSTKTRYLSSSFGWNPQKKKGEIFHQLSRFVLARNVSSSTNPASSGIIAYSIFRFEREDRQDVVYWYVLDSARCMFSALTLRTSYELQVSKECRRFGLGKLLVQILSDIGTEWDMTKIMLTVLKGCPKIHLTHLVAHVSAANITAVLFYKSVGYARHVYW